jgi:hypothetical protein
MSARLLRSLMISVALVAAGAQGVIAASTHLEGHFTQHFGGRNGDGISCPGGEINCGTGRVAGYGAATDAFVSGPDDEFMYVITLADGSTITSVLEFASDSVPGGSNEAPGAGVSFGNPATLFFEATVVSGSGLFEGATGQGTATLVLAGNVDQIALTLDLELP